MNTHRGLRVCIGDGPLVEQLLAFLSLSTIYKGTGGWEPGELGVGDNWNTGLGHGGRVVAGLTLY